MAKIFELKFTMKYAGKKLGLGTEHLYVKRYERLNMGDVHASAEFISDVIAFSETIQDFEAKYKEKAFTAWLDVDPCLTQLFLYTLNAYLEEDNFDNYNYDFRQWSLESLKEIQELIDDGKYTVCNYCKSIIPTSETVTINGGRWEGRVVCLDCVEKINLNHYNK